MIKEQEDIINKLNKIITIFVGSEGELRPHFILTGPSGSGKSHIIQGLAAQNNLNYVEINAAQLTKEGTSGNSLSKALAPLAESGGKPTICFVDEFDKLFISGNSNGELAHEVTNGVQNEFLRVLESETTSVFGDFGKYKEVSIGNVLFVFAGAFNNEKNINIDKLRGFGIKTEFIGRVSLIYNLEKLSLKSMRLALEASRCLKNYMMLFSDANRDDCIEKVMEAIEKQYDNNTLGIRLINTLLHQYFINGGRLIEEEVEKSSFQTQLKLAN